MDAVESVAFSKWSAQQYFGVNPEWKRVEVPTAGAFGSCYGVNLAFAGFGVSCSDTILVAAIASGSDDRYWGLLRRTSHCMVRQQGADHRQPAGGENRRPWNAEISNNRDSRIPTAAATAAGQ
jgi:hypothetical protein